MDSRAHTHIPHSFYVYSKLLAHCIDWMFAVFSLSFRFVLLSSSHHIFVPLSLPHCLIVFLNFFPAVCLSVLLLFRKRNHRKTLFACYATIVNHKLKTWAKSEWVTECLMHGLYDGWLAKCEGSIMYDHKPLYSLAMSACIVILCNVAFHLIWAHSHIILLWHFIESDKICDMRSPFTFIQTIHDGDQFTCVACV